MSDEAVMAEQAMEATASRWRILAVLNGTELYGHEKGQIEVYRSCRRSGHEILVCIPEQARDSALARRLESQLLPYVLLNLGYRWSWAFVKRHPWLPFYNVYCVLRCTFTLSSIFRRFRPTHILIGQPTVFTYVWPVLWWSRLPMIYRIGDCPIEVASVERWLWRQSISRASAIVAVSRCVADAVKRLAGKSSVRLFTIHSVSSLYGSDASSAARPVKRIVLYVGQISAGKGLRHIIGAARLLVQAGNKDIEFHIVGGSPYTQDYEGELAALVAELDLSESVVFHGRQDDVEVYYRSASLHLAPTVVHEAFANVVLEAKSCGVPSVVFSTGGLPEMVNHEKDGYVCPERTAESLAAGIAWCLNSDSRLRRLCKAAAEDAEQRFGQERFDRAWNDVLSKSRTSEGHDSQFRDQHGR